MHKLCSQSPLLRHVRHVKSEYRVVHHSHSLRVRDLVAILNRPFTPIRSNANNFGAIAIVDQRRPDYLFLFSGPLPRCRVPFTIVGPPSSSPSKGLMSISRLKEDCRCSASLESRSSSSRQTSNSSFQFSGSSVALPRVSSMIAFHSSVSNWSVEIQSGGVQEGLGCPSSTVVSLSGSSGTFIRLLSFH